MNEQDKKYYLVELLDYELPNFNEITIRFGVYDNRDSIRVDLQKLADLSGSSMFEGVDYTIKEIKLNSLSALDETEISTIYE